MIDPTDQLEKTPPRPRVALAHDWLVGFRGGEQVLDQVILALQTITDHTPHLYTMFDSTRSITPRIDNLERTTSTLNHMPPALRRWLLMRYPNAVESLSRSLQSNHQQHPIDLLISTSSATIKSLRAPAHTKHLCYCHTPARYLYDQANQYTTKGIKGRARGFGLSIFGPSLRKYDTSTANRVDQFIANSTHTQAQIRTHYNRDSIVIHPPVRTDFFTPDPAVERTGDLLLVSALEPYKRVDLAIDAALLANRPLKIVGSGSHEKALLTYAKRAARKHPHAKPITFLGRINDEQLRDQYRRSAAFLFPQTEDFGITAVEAQACACPVVAYHAGGALDTVLENRTGVFFNHPTAESLSDAIFQLSFLNIDPATIRANAERFSEHSFRNAISAQIRSIFDSIAHVVD